MGSGPVENILSLVCFLIASPHLVLPQFTAAPAQAIFLVDLVQFHGSSQL
jgi:hypothetical protein